MAHHASGFASTLRLPLIARVSPPPRPGARRRRLSLLAGIAGVGTLVPALCMPVMAQQFDRVQRNALPLAVRSIGSFFVGGREVRQSKAEVGLYDGGPLVIDQMYVQYIIPARVSAPPIVLVHGGTLTAKSYETTPDGRMGWYEYFARKGYPTYAVDQVGRGRSGFDQAPFNNVRAGLMPPRSQPELRRVASDVARVRFRVGRADGTDFEGTQFPVDAEGEFAKQAVPDISLTMVPNDKGNPNFTGLAELSSKLGGAILVGHSQAGRFPFEAALLRPDTTLGLVAIEPAGCNAKGYSDREISTLARVPILILFGDYLDVPQSIGPNWAPLLDDCRAFVGRVKAANGNIKLLLPSELKIRGNSHMLMIDRNNLQIADLIRTWVDRSVTKRHGLPRPKDTVQK